MSSIAHIAYIFLRFLTVVSIATTPIQQVVTITAHNMTGTTENFTAIPMSAQTITVAKT